MPQRRRRNIPKPPVETITIQVPLTGKPFQAIWDVIDAYHEIPSEAQDYLSSDEDNLMEMEIYSKLQLLIFLHRLMAWDGTEHLKNLAESVRVSIGQLE